MPNTISHRRLKNILWYRLRTNKSQGQIAEKIGISQSSVNRALRDQIPNLEPSERREILAGIIQRSRDEEMLR